MYEELSMIDSLTSKNDQIDEILGLNMKAFKIKNSKKIKENQ